MEKIFVLEEKEVEQKFEGNIKTQGKNTEMWLKQELHERFDYNSTIHKINHMFLKQNLTKKYLVVVFHVKSQYEYSSNKISHETYILKVSYC